MPFLCRFPHALGFIENELSHAHSKTKNTDAALRLKYTHVCRFEASQSFNTHKKVRHVSPHSQNHLIELFSL